LVAEDLLTELQFYIRESEEVSSYQQPGLWCVDKHYP